MISEDNSGNAETPKRLQKLIKTFRSKPLSSIHVVRDLVSVNSDWCFAHFVIQLQLWHWFPECCYPLHWLHTGPAVSCFRYVYCTAVPFIMSVMFSGTHRWIIFPGYKCILWKLLTQCQFRVIKYHHQRVTTNHLMISPTIQSLARRC